MIFNRFSRTYRDFKSFILQDGHYSESPGQYRKAEFMVDYSIILSFICISFVIFNITQGYKYGLYANLFGAISSIPVLLFMKRGIPLIYVLILSFVLPFVVLNTISIGLNGPYSITNTFFFICILPAFWIGGVRWGLITSIVVLAWTSLIYPLIYDFVGPYEITYEIQKFDLLSITVVNGILLSFAFLALVYEEGQKRLKDKLSQLQVELINRTEQKVKDDFENQLKTLELQMLRMQMNPHFLYNSFNSIQHFIIDNKSDQAVKHLDQFSRLMRMILQNSRLERIPLKEELKALTTYLELEKVRFDNKFDFTITIDPTINPSDVEIPPMLYQPFVENSILHAFKNIKYRGELTLLITQDEHYISCIITDNGIGINTSKKEKSLNTSKKKSMGLEITKTRLELISKNFSNKAKLEIIDRTSLNAKNTGTRVSIKIPY